ncbi:unnamed protein product, partial [marine sediment metagenome]
TPLHHDRAAEWGAAQHTAIGNNAPHHARYADAEAVTAAKTVKLDDFATPDDNVHLNASTTRHGLFKKLDNVIDHFLNGKGNWVEVVGEAATKEFFVPPTSGTKPGAFGYMAGYLVNATADYAYHCFYVPHDFSSITEVVLVVGAVDSRTHRLNFYSSYCAEGEVWNQHAETSFDVDTPINADIICEIDISGILSSLVAGDYVGVKALGDATNTPNLFVHGIRFKYS